MTGSGKFDVLDDDFQEFFTEWKLNKDKVGENRACGHVWLKLSSNAPTDEGDDEDRLGVARRPVRLLKL